jgi:hypothetical protein
MHAAILASVCAALLSACCEFARGDASAVPDIVLRKSTAKNESEPKQRTAKAAKEEANQESRLIPDITLRPGKNNKTAVATPALGATATASAASRRNLAVEKSKVIPVPSRATGPASKSANRSLAVEPSTIIPAVVAEEASSRQTQVQTAGQIGNDTDEQLKAASDGATPVEAGSYIRFRNHSLSQVNFQINEPVETLPPPAAAPAAQPNQEPAPNDPCSALADRPFHEFGINTAIPEGQLPVDDATACWVSVNANNRLAGQRFWGSTVYAWDATCLCHRPLYFEETNLERYGYGCCETLQPAASAAHFFGTIPLLPYCMAVDCPAECVYTLGQYRPGSCVPKRYVWPPCSPRAILAEGGVWTAMIFLIP